MSIRPDYAIGTLAVYEPLGVVKIGGGYVDFSQPDEPEILFNADFTSSNGIRFYYFEDFIGIFYNNQIYEGANPILISSHNIIYDYDTFTPVVGEPFNAMLAKNKLHYICPIDCVTRINEKYTFMKINHYNILVEGSFSASSESVIFAVNDKDNKDYIATIQLSPDDLNYVFGEDPPELFTSADKSVKLHMNDRYKHNNVKCPYAINHDPDCCEIVRFIIPDNVTYVVICSGKIRQIDGTIPGQRTKAAVRESE